MRNPIFGIAYILLVIVQMIICNYFQFSPYFVISILPAMVLCIPLTISTNLCMLLALITGLSVDWLAEGLIGINAASLVPVALARKSIVKMFFGEDLISRGDSFSFNKFGTAKVSAALMSAIAIFLLFYVMLDGAGTRPMWFNLAYFGASLVCNWLLALLVTHLLTPDDRK
jgi:hypothetical protein